MCDNSGVLVLQIISPEDYNSQNENSQPNLCNFPKQNTDLLSIFT